MRIVTFRPLYWISVEKPQEQFSSFEQMNRIDTSSWRIDAKTVQTDVQTVRKDVRTIQMDVTKLWTDPNVFQTDMQTIWGLRTDNKPIMNSLPIQTYNH